MKKNYLKLAVALVAMVMAQAATAEVLEFDFSFPGNKGTGDISYEGADGRRMYVNATQKTLTATDTKGDTYLFDYYHDSKDIYLGQWTDGIQFGASDVQLNTAMLVLGQHLNGITRVEVTAKIKGTQNDGNPLIKFGTLNGRSSESTFDQNSNMYINYTSTDGGKTVTPVPSPAAAGTLSTSYVTYIWQGSGKNNGHLAIKGYTWDKTWFRIQKIKITYESAVPTAEPILFNAAAKLSEADVSHYYGTFSSTRDVIFPTKAKVKVYGVSVNNFGALTLTPLTAADYATEFLGAVNKTVNGYLVAKGQGVLVEMPNGQTTYKTCAYYTYTKASVAEPFNEDNQLKPITADGTIDAAAGCKVYRLTYDNVATETGLGFYWGNPTGTQIKGKAGKAYLEVPESQGISAIRGFKLGGGSTPTGIEAVKVSEESEIANEPIYDLSGRRVQNPTQGFYIQGGKKFIVR